MDMEKFEAALNGRMDNTLSVPEKEELQNFLDENRAARNAAWWYDRMADAFQNADDVEVPNGFTELVMGRIDSLPVYREEPASLMSRLPSWFSGKAAASLAIAASIAGVFFMSQPSEEIDPNLRPVIHTQVEVAQETSKPKYLVPDLKLASLSGNVEILRHDAYGWEKANPSSVVRFRDRIRTQADSTVHVAYDDGTELKLKPGSMVEVLENGIRVFHGKTWIQVVKKGRHFEARTPNLVASVRGTMYDVEVRYPSKSLETAIADLSQRRELLVKSVSPEVYFRDFSLEAVSELARRDADFSVESNVRVFESKVFVAPADVLGPDDSRGLVLSEGEALSLNAGNWNEDLKSHQMARADFAEWGLEAPEALGASSVSPKATPTVVDERRDPGDRQPDIEDLPKPSNNAETLPTESFQQLGN